MTDRLAVSAWLGEAIGAYDRPRAADIALTAIDDGSITIEDLYRILSEIMVDIGEAWQRGTADVWQEHLASGVVRTIVESCALLVEQAAPASRTATVILAAPSEEYHDLGLRMLTDRFTLAGWRAHFLGAHAPASELIAAIQELAADAVVLSASTHFHRVGLRDYVAQVSASHPEVTVWVGGSAFAHAHDGWPIEMILDPRAIPVPGRE